MIGQPPSVVWKDVLTIYASVGLSWYLYKWVASRVSWWNDPERRYDRKGVLALKIDKRVEVPVSALEAFYADGGPEMRISTTELLKQFYLSSAQIIGLLREHLSSDNVYKRRSGLDVLRGLLNEPESGDEGPKNPERLDEILDAETIQHIVLGLMESLEDPNRPSECVYRKEVFQIMIDIDRDRFFYQMFNRVAVDDCRFILAFIQHGITDFLLEYDRMCRNKYYEYMPSLDALTDANSPLYQYAWYEGFITIVTQDLRCKLQLFDWGELLQYPVWRRARLLATGNLTLRDLRCTHFDETDDEDDDDDDEDEDDMEEEDILDAAMDAVDLMV